MLVNLSFVLHQPSTSLEVVAAAKSVRRVRHMSSDPEIVFDGDPGIPVDLWLVPSVGFPDDVPLHVSAPVQIVDRGAQPARQVMLFNSPATLSLPADTVELVGVAALIRRPGNRSLQLITRGPYRLPGGLNEAVNMLETIIQSHVEQWQPGVRLWSAPAEDLLPELSGTER